MKELPLKKKLMIVIIATVVSLFIALYAIRLMGKVIDFAYLEREHILAVTNVQNSLQLASPNKADLMKNITYAQQLAIDVGDSIFYVEKLLFRLLGQGLLLDLAKEDIDRLDLILTKLQSTSDKSLNVENVTAIQKLMIWPIENSAVFGAGLRDVGKFVTVLVIILVTSVISFIVLLIRYIMLTSIPPLEKTTEVTRKIAQGNLNIDLDEKFIEKSTAEMVSGLRSMVSEINIVMSELTDAAHSNASISDKTLNGVNKQQHEINQLSHSISEMSESIQAVAEAALEANNATKEGHKESSAGIQIVNDAVQSISQLAKEVRLSSDAIKKIEADSQSILSIVDMINELTEQTNLLALNAAIEAARAGEQGRGFAVVADEVRSLAQRTQDSTSQIQSTIDELRKSTTSAVTIMDNCCDIADASVLKANDAGTSIQNAAKQMSDIVSLNERISDAAETQASATRAISVNTQTINSVAEEAANGAKQTAKSSEHLSVLIVQVKGVINKFHL